MESARTQNDSLTLAQKRAVEQRGNVLVMAGAGTGKTHTLARVVALLAGRSVPARRAALTVAALIALYTAALLGSSLASRERTLAPGEEKSVSVFDPHLHFGVAGPAGRGPDGALLVTVRLRSDALQAMQDPRCLSAALVDARGNVVGIVAAKLNARAALAATGSLPENVNYAVKSSLLLSFLESVPDVAAKLKEPLTAERKFEDVVKSAQAAAVLVLVY